MRTPFGQTGISGQGGSPDCAYRKQQGEARQPAFMRGGASQNGAARENDANLREKIFQLVSGRNGNDAAAGGDSDVIGFRVKPVVIF